MNGIASDFTRAYADSELYKNAIENVNTNHTAVAILGDIQPIDKLAILGGSVNYSNDNKTVSTSIIIIGTKGKGKLDISADKEDGTWNYKTITIRIKHPKEKQQTLAILTSE